MGHGYKKHYQSKEVQNIKYQMCSCQDCLGCNSCKCKSDCKPKKCGKKSDCASCFIIPDIVILSKNAPGPCGAEGVIEVKEFIEFPREDIFLRVLGFNTDYIKSAFVEDNTVIKFITADNPPKVGKVVEDVIKFMGVSPSDHYEALGTIHLGIKDLCRFENVENCNPCTGKEKPTPTFNIFNEGQRNNGVDFQVI